MADTYKKVRGLVADATEEGFLTTHEDMVEELADIAEEYPEGIAKLKEENTAATEQYLNRMQFDNEDIIERSPDALKELDTYLLEESPYALSVALGSENSDRVGEDGPLGYVNQKYPYGTEKRGRIPGMAEDISYTAMHETGHYQGLMGDDGLEDAMSRLGSSSKTFEAATTGLDLYRALSNGNQKEAKHAIEYLMSQGVNMWHPGERQELKDNILAGVERLYDKSDGQISLTDEKRQAIKDDLDKNFTQVEDLMYQFREEYEASKNAKMDKLTQHHLTNLANGWTVEAENGEGTHTIYTASVERDGKEYVFPTIWEGKILSIDEAFDRAMEEGVYEEFNSPQEATAFDRMIHEQNPILGGAMRVIPAEEAQSILDSRGEEMKPKFNCGGMLEVISMGGLMGDDMIIGHDPVSGNPIPPGSNAENVRDDIPAALSDGEYVVPADVVRYHGLKTFMSLRAEAKMGLMAMHEEGQIVEVETDEDEEDDVHVTPEGNEVEVAKVETEEETLEEEVEAAEGGDVRKGYLQKERMMQAAADAAADEMAIENGYTPNPPGVGLASPEEDPEIPDDYVDTKAQAAADAAADEMAAENAIVEKVIRDSNGNEVTVLYDTINDEIVDPDEL